MTVFLLIAGMDYEYSHVTGVYASRGDAVSASLALACTVIRDYDYEPEALEGEDGDYRVQSQYWRVTAHQVI